ncbi:MAG TPA: hypothetical protein VNF72_10445, partial [Myxococcota bacterium]|nr:hypothetical protein [Myxococcota bacterium]
PRALETARLIDPAPLAACARAAGIALDWDGIARAYRELYGLGPQERVAKRVREHARLSA